MLHVIIIVIVIYRYCFAFIYYYYYFYTFFALNSYIYAICMLYSLCFYYYYYYFLLLSSLCRVHTFLFRPIMVNCILEGGHNFLACHWQILLWSNVYRGTLSPQIDITWHNLAWMNVCEVEKKGVQYWFDTDKNKIIIIITKNIKTRDMKKEIFLKQWIIFYKIGFMTFCIYIYANWTSSEMRLCKIRVTKMCYGPNKWIDRNLYQNS